MASTVMATAIFFIATIFIASIVGVQFVTTVQTQDAALDSQRDSLSQKIRTDFIIETAGYNSAEEQVIIYLRNTGKERINPARLDVYINGSKVDKCSYYAADITQDSETSDAEYFNPGEILQIAFYQEVSNSPLTIIITDSLGNSKIKKMTPLDTTESVSTEQFGTCENLVNTAPETVGVIPNQEVENGESINFSVAGYFTDADTIGLSYSVESGATVNTTIVSSILTIEGLSLGDSQVNVTADDGELTATQSFTATVVPFEEPPECFIFSDPSTITLGGTDNDVFCFTDSGETLVLETTFSNPGIVSCEDIDTAATSMQIECTGESVGTTMVYADISDDTKTTSIEYTITVE